MSFDDLKETLMKEKHSELILTCTSHTPYDGCWHEPNYWVLTDHRVYPLYISGKIYGTWYNGDREPWLHGIPWMNFLLEMERRQNEYDDWETFDPEEWELENYNVLNSITVILFIHEVTPPKWTCTICGEECRGRAKLLSYRGNGGIGVCMEDPCCDRCFYEHKWCDTCNGYVRPTEMVEIKDVNGKFGGGRIPPQCPNAGDEDEGYHKLWDMTDEGAAFGLTGDKFLGPDGDVEGLQGVCIVIAQKGT